MKSNEIVNRYFDWICSNVYDSDNYNSLMTVLFNIPFRYSLPMDANRDCDGIDLRYHFGQECDLEQAEVAYYLDTLRNSTVLEMLVALSIRMESIMDDADTGNRVGQWFWGMIVNLGLGYFSDDRFDEEEVRRIVDRFLDREYEPNGEGGLVTLNNPKQDLRDVEIWYQVMWYLNEVIEEG